MLFSNDDEEVWHSRLFGLSLMGCRSKAAPSVSVNHIENLGIAVYSAERAESLVTDLLGHEPRPLIVKLLRRRCGVEEPSSMDANGRVGKGEICGVNCFAAAVINTHTLL